MIPPPPDILQLAAGTVLFAGAGTATVLPDLDFETYSEGGFLWDDAAGKWTKPPPFNQGSKTNKKGLGIVGAARYTEHPSAEVLSLAYDLKGWNGYWGRKWWRPGDPPPLDLFEYIAAGGFIEAHNSGFEGWVWRNICVPKYGWPPLPQRQQRCSMAKARAHALPGALDDLSNVLQLTHRKNPDGKRLLDKFSIPRNPTKTDPRRRVELWQEPEDAVKLYTYNGDDIAAEAEASSRIPDLSPDELEVWLCDQEINTRGVAVDTPAIENCVAIIEQAYERYNAELVTLTGGVVERASQLERLKGWLAGFGVHMQSMDEDAITEALKDEWMPIPAWRALTIRQLVGAASVKKLYALRNQTTNAGRVHDLFLYHVGRTGRFAGADAQPQNLPKSGPDLFFCDTCKKFHGAHTHVCPWCAAIHSPTKKKLEWTGTAVEDALEIIATRSLDLVEMFFGDAVKLVSGCVRGLLVAGPGKDFICSDYSAIEAVVLAALAGEEWRLEVFRTHGKIYEASASKITGIPFADFETYKKETGQHRPERGKIGKVAELASGYQGWVGAWKNFGADAFFSDDEIKKHVLAWRAESPAIVEFWGGQERNKFDNNNYYRELYGLEGAAISAVMNPGQLFTVHANHPDSRPVSYFVYDDVLYCRLPSGRLLTYHRPRLTPSSRPYQEGNWTLSFMTWNSNPKMGAAGWVRMETYGGKLTENVVQAVSRDILAYALVNLARAGYPIVLHVHDEIVAEVEKEWGSVEEFERIMGTLPAWCSSWPVKAAGGWRGLRYRKD